MDDLAQLAAAVTKFAAVDNLTVVPAVPEHDYGPEVCLGPDAVDLPGFLALAGKLGSGVLYLRAVPFEPASDDQPEDPPAHLVRRKGQIGEISVAFAAGGLVHFWEHQAAWHREWQELAKSQSSRRDFDLDDADGAERLSAEERERLASELAGTILADPRFRGAPRSDRQRRARLKIPKGTGSMTAWDAVREACDQAQQMAEEQYDQITGRLDELAAEFLASPGYQQASSATARKDAAERFLIPHADGFCPPPLVRDELYARAQQLARAARSQAGGLF
ncbi:MAG: hypothetical protein ACRDPY_11985 [Streptosporangiaceae bacterium]